MHVRMNYSSCSVVITGAVATQDFQSQSQTVTLTSSLRRRCIHVPIVHDSEHEATEELSVIMARNSLPSFVVLSPNSTIIRIINTESKEYHAV